MPKPMRRAGTPWRILVHSMEPGGRSGDSWHVGSDRRFGGGGEDSSVEVDGRIYHSRNIELPNTDFDELVVGRWAHIEQLDTGLWWMNIGGVVVHVQADRDGRPTKVTVEGPDYDGEPVSGCTYELRWDDE